MELSDEVIVIDSASSHASAGRSRTKTFVISRKLGRDPKPVSVESASFGVVS
jgi:hypothetical protein